MATSNHLDIAGRVAGKSSGKALNLDTDGKCLSNAARKLRDLSFA